MNEKWLVNGYREVSFTDQKTNKLVEGYTLFLSRRTDPGNAADKNVVGDITDKLFISAEYVKYDPEVGDEIVLLYNKFGKVGSIQVI